MSLKLMTNKLKQTESEDELTGSSGSGHEFISDYENFFIELMSITAHYFWGVIFIIALLAFKTSASIQIDKLNASRGLKKVRLSRDPKKVKLMK